MSNWRPPGPPGNHRSGPGFSGGNHPPIHGGSNGIQRSSAAQLKESEALFSTYEHLSGLPRGDDALLMLRRIASVVKPIMRKRGWKVQVLAEFLPPEQNLLGLNINKGYKICIRLRYHNNPDLFLPFEECVDTMLHELSHNVWGDHDSNFHKLWDELRDEHEVLVRRGYTGEGFLGSGNRLGGSTYVGSHQLPAHELRRLARASAEKRKQQGTLGVGSGQRLGGAPIHRGQDIRSVIVDQVTKRNNAMNRGGCASGRQDAGQLSQQSSDHTFKTQAEEDDANNRAIAQALFELMEQEEEQKLNGTFQESKAGDDGGLQWSKENGLYDASEVSRAPRSLAHDQLSEEEQLKWAMEESMRGLAAAAGPSSPSKASNERITQPSKPEPSANGRKRPASELSLSPPKPPEPEPSSTPTPNSSTIPPAETLLDQWTCEICTCINPVQFLACDACGIERPQSQLIPEKPKAREPRRSGSITRKPVPSSRDVHVKPLPKMTAAERFPVKPPDPNGSLGWKCGFCGSFMEHEWWTCSACGTLKDSS